MAVVSTCCKAESDIMEQNEAQLVHPSLRDPRKLQVEGLPPVPSVLPILYKSLTFASVLSLHLQAGTTWSYRHLAERMLHRRVHQWDQDTYVGLSTVSTRCCLGFGAPCGIRMGVSRSFGFPAQMPIA